MVHGEPMIGRAIRELRVHAGWTQERLARAIGCSTPHLSLMETGQRRVSVERAERIESVLEVVDQRLVSLVKWRAIPPDLRERLERAEESSHQLTTELQEALSSAEPAAALRRIVDEMSSNVEPTKPLTERIPVINKVAAGYPCEFTDLDYPVSVADEYITCPDVADPNAFAARVVGDSMEPDYREGEIVIFSPSAPIQSGTDCFIRLERDNETTFKRVFFETDGRSVRLQPLNNRYPPRVVGQEDITGLYAAAYVVRKV